MVRPLDESQESSPLQGYGSWLMCEVTLIVKKNIVSSTLTVNPKLFVAPCKILGELYISSVAITVTYQVGFHPYFKNHP